MFNQKFMPRVSTRRLRRQIRRFTEKLEENKQRRDLDGLIDAGFNEFVKKDRTNKSVLSKGAVLLDKFISECVQNELFSI